MSKVRSLPPVGMRKPDLTKQTVQLLQHEETHKPTGIMCSVEFNEGALENNVMKLNEQAVGEIVNVTTPPTRLKITASLNRHELQALSWFYTQLCTQPDLYVARIA